MHKYLIVNIVTLIYGNNFQQLIILFDNYLKSNLKIDILIDRRCTIHTYLR